MDNEETSETLAEKVDEMDEDLQLQAQLLLADGERNQLKQSGFLFVTQDRLVPFLTKIRQYLQMTPITERTWSLCRVQDLGTNSIFNYVFIIKD